MILVTIYVKKDTLLTLMIIYCCGISTVIVTLVIGMNFFDWDKISADIIKREEKNKLKQK